MTPVRLLSFPRLVHDIIFQHMSLMEKFILSTLSKKGRTVIKESVPKRQNRLLVEIEDDYYHLRLNRNLDEKFDLNFFKQRSTKNLWKLPNFLDHQTLFAENNINGLKVHCKNRKKVFKTVIEYLATIFRVHKMRLNFESVQKNEFLEVIRPIKKLEIKKTSVVVSGKHIETHTKLVRTVFKECHDVEELQIYYRASPDNLDLYDVKPLSVNTFKTYPSDWITKSHIIQFLMNCKCVELGESMFSNKELTEIFKEWIEGARMESLNLQYRGNSLEDVFKCIQGAVPVRRARFNGLIRDYGEGQCYKIQQKDGRSAVVDIVRGYLSLKTEFEFL